MRRLRVRVPWEALTTLITSRYEDGFVYAPPQQKGISLYISTTDHDTPTLTVGISNTDVTLNLTKSEAYNLLTQLSRQLVDRFGDINYLITADNVIATLKSAYYGESNYLYIVSQKDKDVVSDFLELDKDTQRDTASDALDNIVSTYEVCDIDAPIENIVKHILAKAALTIIKSRRAA